MIFVEDPDEDEGLTDEDYYNAMMEDLGDEQRMEFREREERLARDRELMRMPRFFTEEKL